jgi:hypothetical protein
MVRVGFDLFAQTTHVDVNRAWRNPRSLSPHGIKQLIACKHPPAMIREIFQETKFSHGCRHEAALYPNRHRQWVDFHITQLDWRGSCRIRARAQYASYSRDEFPGAERFHDVIVAAQLEATDPILSAVRAVKNDWTLL